MNTKPVIGPERRTHPLVWCAAVICIAFAVMTIIAGVVVFIGYMVIHPRVPFVSVSGAHLDDVEFDQAGLLQVRMTIIIRAENDNAEAHASFSDALFTLYARSWVPIAKLASGPFQVRKNSSVEFHYVVESAPIPLDVEMAEYIDASLKQNRLYFGLKGHARARWHVGFLGSVKFMCYLNCQLEFRPRNGSYVNSPCTSRTK